MVRIINDSLTGSGEQATDTRLLYRLFPNKECSNMGFATEQGKAMAFSITEKRADYSTEDLEHPNRTICADSRM